tara:strand:+ start:999 stop:1319 length:321 start_codon:yes stop_codon:yes gene_type:complete
LAVLLLFKNIPYGQFEKLRGLQQKLIDDERTGKQRHDGFSEWEGNLSPHSKLWKKEDKDIQKDTIFPVYSMTKSITIAGMLLLHGKGLVKWDDPVSKYIPYFTDLK